MEVMYVNVSDIHGCEGSEGRNGDDEHRQRGNERPTDQHFENIETVENGDQQNQTDNDQNWVESLQRTNGGVRTDNAGPEFRMQQAEVKKYGANTKQ